MSAALPKPWTIVAVAPWALAVAGFGAMYLHSYWEAANGLWQSDDFGHAPIILAVVVWLFWQIRKEIQVTPDRPRPLLGWSLLSLGVVLYIFGRTFSIASVEFLSQPLVVAALFLLFKGLTALRIAWFAVVYLFFMVPLPGVLVDAITSPLKDWISAIVVEALYIAGYPIARVGVMIEIGQYQLLVADACSGLRSILTLSAVGTLFIYLMARRSIMHNLLMLLALVPIAFLANLVRVFVLVLVTYYFGDEAGQEFLHGAAGILLLLFAVAILIALDTLLRAVLRMRGSALTTSP